MCVCVSKRRVEELLGLSAVHSEHSVTAAVVGGVSPGAGPLLVFQTNRRV